MHIEELNGYKQKWLHTSEHIKDLKKDFIFSELYHDIVISHLWYNNIRNVSELYSLNRNSLDSYLEKFYVLYDAAFAVRSLLSRGHEVFVYTDYDTDGGMAAAILIDFLKKAYGYKIEENLFWMASIRAEGYGISKNAVMRIVEKHPNALVFILDTGGSSYTDLRNILNRNGYTVVIDHHNITDEVRSLIHKYNNLYFINPKAWEYHTLYSVCSGALSYLFVRALALTSGSERLYELAETYVDCAAIATIADYVPYSGINSLIVHSGFEKYKAEPRIFFEALTNTDKYPIKTLRDFVIAIGWYLAPRLNAAGRSSHADIMLQTILLGMGQHPENVDEFQKVIKKIEEIYQNVKQERSEYETHVMNLINQKYGGINEDTSHFVVFTDNPHEAPLSAVITKMAFRYNVPVFIFANKLDRWSGSGRLPKDLINLYPAAFEILKNNGIFKVNGHYGAFGVLLDEIDKSAQVEKAVEDFLQNLGAYKKLIGINKSFMHGIAKTGNEVMQVCEEIKGLGLYKSDDSPKFMIDTSMIEAQKLGYIIQTNKDTSNNIIRVVTDKDLPVSISTIMQSKYAIASYDINSSKTPTIIIHDVIRDSIKV
jgi:single-stranded DNA-specific DHH superfamily exonuclease